MNIRPTKMALAMVFGLAATVASATSTPKGFVDVLDEALAASAKDRKPVVAVFTGSDWCPACKNLERNVFSKPEFVRDATKEFVLMFVDNPSNKSLLSPQALKANPALIERYDIDGRYPTILMLDCLGQCTVRLGHGAANPEGLIAAARRGRDSNRARFDKSYEIAAMKKGSSKRLRAIADLVKGIDPAKHRDYPVYCGELLAKGAAYRDLVPYYSVVKPLEEEVKKITIELGDEFKKVSARHGMTPESVKSLTPEEAEALSAKVSGELVQTTYPKFLRRAKALLGKVKTAEAKTPAALRGDLDKVRSGAEATVKRLEDEIAHRKDAARGKGKKK